MFGWTIQRKKKYTCLVCGVEVDPHTAPRIQFKYIEDDQPKIGVRFVCEDHTPEVEDEPI